MTAGQLVVALLLLLPPLVPAFLAGWLFRRWVPKPPRKPQ